MTDLKNNQDNQDKPRVAKHGGSREGAGRIKGTPNKLTTDVKNMILQALEGKGGHEYLMKQADENPTAFMTLLGKVLPMTVAGDPDAPLIERVVVEIVSSDN